MSECVYFMRAFFRTKIGKHSVGFVHWKIGRTYNIERRRTTFQTACPVPIEVVGTLSCGGRGQSRAIERELHEYFSDCRVMGEWFSFSDRQTKSILALVERWPITQPIAAFLNDLPKQIECGVELPRIRTEFVPHAALHEARLQIKDLRDQLAAAERRAAESVEKCKNAIDYLTDKYTQAIQKTHRAPH